VKRNKKKKREQRIRLKKWETKKKKSNKWWPAIFCLEENFFIGFSYETMKFKNLKPKYGIIKKHWSKNNSKFRKGYEIDMTQFKTGDLVRCPNCGGLVDFRLWISSEIPRLI